MARKRRDHEFPENGFEMWGGYMNAKIAKLEEQFVEETAKEVKSVSDLFSGVSIFVNGYTKPTANELKMLMAEHGGIYHHYFKSDKTKFIIASNLPDTKVKNLPTTKISKPEWITDSIAAGTLLDYKDYLLYSNYSKTQQRIKFKDVNQTKSNHTESSIDYQANSTNDAIHSPNTIPLPKPSPDPDGAKGKCAATAVDPKFLSEFYNNSRLHHISQLGAGFKQYVNQLRTNSDFVYPKREELRKHSASVNSSLSATDGMDSNDKVIMHIDMDCFFVSVGLRKYPQLRGVPVAVTHSKGGVAKHKRDGVDRRAEFNMYKERKKNQIQKAIGKTVDDYDSENDIPIKSRVDDLSESVDGGFGSMSEIASCSYEARALGLHNGMFMGAALRLCPDLKTIPYDFDAYKEVAFLLYNTVAEYTLDIEAVSCDEMYVDCTELLRDVGMSAMKFAAILRRRIKEKTGCPCSTGFGANRLQARMATKKAKPDGQYYLHKDDVEAYFSNVALGDLPGVGHQMENKLTALGYTDCASLRNTTLLVLQKHFGNKTGQLLYNYARGIDDKPLHYTSIRKSISAGVNYGIRFEDNSQAETFLRQLCLEVCSRMSQNNVVGKSITLKLMVRSPDAPVETAKYMGHGFCDTINKTSNLSQCTNNIDIITNEVLELCKRMNSKVEDMRGISIQISKLEDTSDKPNKKGGIECFLKQTKDLKTPENVDNKNKINENLEISKNISYTNGASSERHRNVVEKKVVEVKRVSPVKKNKSLGLTGRRRGRPPKNSFVANTSKVDKNETINKFLSNRTSDAAIDNSGNFVDEEFLNALPDDIKSEILASYKVKNKIIEKPTPKTPSPIQINKSTKTDIKIDPEYLNALPDDLRKEIEANIDMYGALSYSDHRQKEQNSNNRTQTTNKTNENIKHIKEEQKKMAESVNETRSSDAKEVEELDDSNNLMNLGWRELKPMLRDWFASSAEPLECDVDVIMKYLQNLMCKRKVEDVYYLLKFMHRILTENSNNCAWHKVYLDFESGVQNIMMDIYEMKLDTQTNFNCCTN